MRTKSKPSDCVAVRSKRNQNKIAIIQYRTAKKKALKIIGCELWKDLRRFLNWAASQRRLHTISTNNWATACNKEREWNWAKPDFNYSLQLENNFVSCLRTWSRSYCWTQRITCHCGSRQTLFCNASCRSDNWKSHLQKWSYCNTRTIFILKW